MTELSLFIVLSIPGEKKWSTIFICLQVASYPGEKNIIFLNIFIVQSIPVKKWSYICRYIHIPELSIYNYNSIYIWKIKSDGVIFLYIYSFIDIYEEQIIYIYTHNGSCNNIFQSLQQK